MNKLTDEKRIIELDHALDKLRIREKDSNQRKVYGEVFDEFTLKGLYILSRRKEFDALGGVISTGKEAHVLIADKGDSMVAVKVYMINTSNFNTMADYILGDHRFRGIKRDRRSIILAWAQKEYKNLKRAWDSGVSVPEPFSVHNNILIMDFIGEDESPYPPMKVVGSELGSDSSKAIEDLIKNVEILYQEAELVHGDLSEYNALWNMREKKVVLIDMGQSVSLEHPRAQEFLERDVYNIVRFARKLGISLKKKEILERIKGE
ncbi:MAG: serine protein kinase RIO [Methermicoccaceae archaeon]